MSRLSATDAFFLYADSPDAPMNMGSVQILKMPAGRNGDYFADLKNFLADRIEYLPKLKQRLLTNQLGLPYWADYDAFDFDQHVRRIRLRSGDKDALARKLGELQFLPFDMRKPPFMFYLIEGWSQNRVALVQKFHHALADGKTAVRIMDLFSDEGLERARRDIDQDIKPVPGPIVRSLSGAVEDLRRTVASVPGVVGVARKMMGSAGQEMRDRMASLPEAAFNKPLSDKRLFVYRNWSLDKVQKVRRAAGLTFNEMGLAMLGGALRRYFDETNQLPDDSLVCNCPVALKGGGDSGNAVFATSIPLGSHIADRHERVKFLKAESEASKDSTSEIISGASAGDGIQLPSLAVMTLGKLSGSSWVAEHSPPQANISMSNVPGPPEPIHVAGLEVETLYGLPMILHGISVSVTFSSYASHTLSSILCCAEALPDPEKLHDYMGDELAALEKLFLKPKDKKKAKSKSKKRQAKKSS